MSASDCRKLSATLGNFDPVKRVGLCDGYTTRCKKEHGKQAPNLSNHHADAMYWGCQLAGQPLLSASLMVGNASFTQLPEKGLTKPLFCSEPRKASEEMRIARHDQDRGTLATFSSRDHARGTYSSRGAHQGHDAGLSRYCYNEQRLIQRRGSMLDLPAVWRGAADASLPVSQTGSRGLLGALVLAVCRP